MSLYEAGLSIADVAEHYRISRQAMHSILRRRGVRMRPKLRFATANHFHRGGSSASDRAQNLAEKAVKRGILARGVACESCGITAVMRDGRSAIQAHHDDYNHPLAVRWLCQPCHFRWHSMNKAIPERRV